MNGAGVDLNLFAFDYDLTWAAFFMNHRGHVYARYGTRKEVAAESMMSKTGLKYVMKKVLDAHAKDPDRKPVGPKRAPFAPESFKSLPPKLRSGQQCMHCHQVWDYMRKDNPRFSKVEVLKTYPLPENLGMTFELDRPNVVASVERSSIASRARILKGDEILEMNGTPVYSSADASSVLHNLGKGKSISTALSRKGRKMTVRLAPRGNWRYRDISWRGSMWSLQPASGWWAKQLTDGELRQNGLRPGTFATQIRGIVNWASPGLAAGKAVKAAGLRKGDVVLSVNGKRDFESEREFQAWFRLNHKAGDPIRIEILRGGKRQVLSLKAAP